jgi:electron transport complex protein RnfC
MLRGFMGGLILPAGKTVRNRAIESMPHPKIAYVPLVQYKGMTARPVIEIGTDVRIGDQIAEAKDNMSVGVHAPISGRVKDISDYPHPLFGTGLCCVIEAVEAADADYGPREKADYDRSSPDELRAALRDLGVVGMGGAGFPTWVKLTPPSDKPVDALIVNGCESEPMVSADHRLMLEYPMNIIEGARIFQKILDARQLVFAFADDQRETAEIFKKEGAVVRCLRRKFPLGSEKQLIRAVADREVPRGGLPWDIGCVVHNVATCYAGFQAIAFRKPVVERVVTVAGEGIKEPKNLMVRIGTLAREIIDYCGGYAGTPTLIVFGGPMTGQAQPTDQVPVTKETTAILVFASEPENQERPCVRCARCVDVCPAGLVPCDLYRCIADGVIPDAEALGLSDCLECGACAYSCPSRIPLVHFFKYGKAELRERIP